MPLILKIYEIKTSNGKKKHKLENPTIKNNQSAKTSEVKIRKTFSERKLVKKKPLSVLFG